MKKKPLLVANWKLNHSRKSAADFCDSVLEKISDQKKVDLAIAPVAPMLDFLAQKLAKSRISLCAQNVFSEEKGAFTGEWSTGHLRELDVEYCIVGHSERRTLFFESDELVAKKANACLNAGIVPIICIGETEEQRDQGLSAGVVEKQLRIVLSALGDHARGDLVLAYEPVWAIGTGKSASAAEAEDVHRHIYEISCQLLNKSQVASLRILYGGSVSPENISEIVTMPHIDGALVGGASLQAQTFLSMVKAFRDLGDA